MLTRRRMIQGLAVTGIAAWVWGAPRLPRLFEEPFTFSDIPGAAPFRRLDRTGPTSAVNAVFAGLDAAPRVIQTVPLCRYLFGGAPTGIAVFTDVNCPNCPQMDADVRRAADGTAFRVHHKMLPILGPGSELAARAFIAAEAQSDAGPFQDRIMRAAASPSPRLIRQLAEEHGLDADQLLRDMRSPDTQARLDRDRSLADQLGLIGTPATVIGRTTVLGRLPLAQIRQIIALEQDMEPPCA